MAKEGVILKSIILRQTRAVISPTVAKGDAEDTCILGFDYLDPNDGFVVQVIHSGPRRAMECCGSFKELPRGMTRLGAGLNKKRNSRRGRLARRLSKIPFYLMLALGILIATIALLDPRLLQRLNAILEAEKTDKVNWPLFLTGAMYAALPVFVLWSVRRRYPASLVDPGEDDVSLSSYTPLTWLWPWRAAEE